MKHIFREHNQEADHWANVGAGVKKEIVVDKGSKTEKWKAVKGFWDGSCKDNGRRKCGVIVKGVDKENGSRSAKLRYP